MAHMESGTAGYARFGAQGVYSFNKISPGFHANRFSGSLVSQSDQLAGAYVRIIDAKMFNLYTLLTALIATIAILRHPAFHFTR